MRYFRNFGRFKPFDKCRVIQLTFEPEITSKVRTMPESNMLIKPIIPNFERLLAILIFGFIIFFAFNAGYWRHDDPTYTANEWHEFQGAGRFLLAFLHPWASTLTGGVAFSLSCALVYLLAIRQLPHDQTGRYLIPWLLILNIPFFEITTWSGQSLIALSMLALPELILRNYRAKVFFSCVLVWGVHPSYAPLCLIYFAGNMHDSNLMREALIDALCFVVGIVVAYITVRLLQGAWFGFEMTVGDKAAFGMSDLLQRYESAVLQVSPRLIGGNSLYGILLVTIFATTLISIAHKRRDSLYFSLIAISLLLFWPLLFGLSPWQHWGSPRNFIFLGVVFYFAAISMRRLANKTWIYLFIIASSLPAQMALTNFYAFSTETRAIKNAFKELVGNHEGLVPVIVDARQGHVTRWVRLPYGRQESFSDNNINVPRFDRAMPISLCVSEDWSAYEQRQDHIVQNCQYFDTLNESDLIACSASLPVLCSYGAVNNRILLKIVD